MLTGTAKSGAMMMKIPLEKLTHDASLIVLGQVTSIENKKIEEGYYRFATIQVEKTIKGRLAYPVVVVKHPGNIIGDSPDYQVGERVLVFLKKAGADDYYQTIGQFQGKFLIKEETIVRNKIPVEDFIQKVRGLSEHDTP